MEATYPKSPTEMYHDLSGIQEGGSLYTLNRTEPFNIDYIDRISRTRTDTPDATADSLYVYLTTSRGTDYRIAIDVEADRCAMEIKRDGKWATFSNALSGFRYRSPNHPQQGANWKRA